MEELLKALREQTKAIHELAESNRLLIAAMVMDDEEGEEQTPTLLDGVAIVNAYRDEQCL